MVTELNIFIHRKLKTIIFSFVLFCTYDKAPKCVLTADYDIVCTTDCLVQLYN